MFLKKCKCTHTDICCSEYIFSCFLKEFRHGKRDLEGSRKPRNHTNTILIILGLKNMGIMLHKQSAISRSKKHLLQVFHIAYRKKMPKANIHSAVPTPADTTNIPSKISQCSFKVTHCFHIQLWSTNYLLSIQKFDFSVYFIN